MGVVGRYGKRGKNVVGMIGLCLALLTILSWAQSDAGVRLKTDRTPVHHYRVIGSYPHDRQAFTQGLAYEGGFFKITYKKGCKITCSPSVLFW